MIDLTSGMSADREYLLKDCPVTPDIRDAVNVWLEATDGSFGMRIGVEANSSNWDQNALYLDIAYPSGRVIYLRGNFAGHAPIGSDGLATTLGAGPAKFSCEQPFEKWSVEFNGAAFETTATQLISGKLPDRLPSSDVKFEIKMTMAAPPWVSGTLLSDAAEVLRGEQGDFMSPRYEQLFRAVGTLRVNNKKIDLRANGLRIRRQGFRKFEGFWGHCWQSALFPSGKAFGCNVFPPRADGQPSFNEGYVFDGDGPLRPARVIQAPWLNKLTTGGDDVSLILETVEGRTIAVKGRTFVNTRSIQGIGTLPSDYPTIQQSHAHYRWDGEDTVGIAERSSTQDKFKN